MSTREAADFNQLCNELIQQDLEIQKYLTELLRSGEGELKWLETGADRHDLVRLQEGIARSNGNIADLTRLRDGHWADIERHCVEIHRRHTDLERRYAENKQLVAEVRRALREPDLMVPKVLQCSKG